MRQIGLRQDEVQDTRISIGSSVYNVHLFAFRGLMYIDVMRDGEYIVAGKRIIANQWLLPHYVRKMGGNFRFETYQSDREEYVWYTGFNTKFRLTVYGSEEIDENEQ